MLCKVKSLFLLFLRYEFIKLIDMNKILGKNNFIKFFVFFFLASVIIFCIRILTLTSLLLQLFENLPNLSTLFQYESC